VTQLIYNIFLNKNFNLDLHIFWIKFAIFHLVMHQVFLRCFRDLVRVPRIRENYHLVLRIRENRVPTGPCRVPNTFLKKAEYTFFVSAIPITIGASLGLSSPNKTLGCSKYNFRH